MATKKTPASPGSKTDQPLNPKKSAVEKGNIPAKPKPTTRKKRVEKASPSKIPSPKGLPGKLPIKEPVIPHEEISLRAYFIAERRHKMGWPGDSATDWTDAVKQLRAEALEKPLKKR